MCDGCVMANAVVLGVILLGVALVFTWKREQTSKDPPKAAQPSQQDPPQQRSQAEAKRGMEDSAVVRDVAKGATQRGTIVFLHGLGDDGRGWAAELSQRFRDFRVVCPNAPQMAVTANRGARMSSWFDMVAFSAKVLLDEKLDPGHGMADSVRRVHAVLDREVELLGGKSRLVVLGGFSQGAALALQAGLSYARPLGGIVACSGWAVAWSTLKIHDANRDTRVQLHHGKYDEIIPLPCSDALVAKLEAAKIKAERFVSNQEHGFDDWGRVAKFIGENTAA